MCIRDRTYPQLIELSVASYKADYRLVPNSEEAELIAKAKATPPKVRVLSNSIPFPPLLKVCIYFSFDIIESQSLSD